MSQKFFEELNIPEPDYNLGISGGTHGQMTGRMIIAIEEVLMKEKPDWLLIYDDTNSTLAAALASAKLHIPVCHVEVGGRLHTLSNPEEINRICTDHVSTLLLASIQSHFDELAVEGLQERGILVGDPMYDAFLEYGSKIKKADVRLQRLDGGKAEFVPEEYYYLTCHREENTGRDQDLLGILHAMEQLDAPVIYPVHPRNKKRAIRLCSQYGLKNTRLCEPVGYLESICLVNNAKKIVTDSGGLQREAFFAEKKCVTVFDFVAWPETMYGNRNQLARPNEEDILQKLNTPQVINSDYKPFGDGHSAVKIVKALEDHLEYDIHF